MAGFYFVLYGAYERGTGRIQIRFYEEIWRETVIGRAEVPHGKVAVHYDWGKINNVVGISIYGEL